MIVAEVYKINYHMKNYKSKEELELIKKVGYNSVQFYENRGWLCVIGSK